MGAFDGFKLGWLLGRTLGLALGISVEINVGDEVGGDGDGWAVGGFVGPLVEGANMVDGGADGTWVLGVGFIVPVVGCIVVGIEVLVAVGKAEGLRFRVGVVVLVVPVIVGINDAMLGDEDG